MSTYKETQVSRVAMAQDQDSMVIQKKLEGLVGVSILKLEHSTTSTSEFTSALESLSSLSINPEVGTALNITSENISAPLRISSDYYSTRIQRLVQYRRREIINPLEFEIEASKDHWSELLNPACAAGEPTETNLEVFKSLQKQYGCFFKGLNDRFLMGDKIAEGGQAEIFDAVWKNVNGMGEANRKFVLKVFKEIFPLRDLQKQWPLGMLPSNPRRAVIKFYNCTIYGGTLLGNGRFAFMMPKYWGDLRRLIDMRMEHNSVHNYQRPPFTDSKAEATMQDIAMGMLSLHKKNVVHNDLKAANVLISPGYLSLERFDPVNDDKFLCSIADFESSVGVVGTGYWRAPEILCAVKNQNFKHELFSKSADVYSYAMTCYEILTGRIPFEDLRKTDYDVVLSGKRLDLSRDIKPWIKEMINRCWHANPSKRYTFAEIAEIFKEHIHK